MQLKALLLLLNLGVFLFSCGFYSLAGSIPPHIKTLNIPLHTAADFDHSTTSEYQVSPMGKVTFPTLGNHGKSTAIYKCKMNGLPSQKQESLSLPLYTAAIFL